MDQDPNNLNNYSKENIVKTTKKRYRGVLFFVLLATTLIYTSSKFGFGSNEIEVSDKRTLWGKISNIFTVNSEKKPTIDSDPDYVMPKEEKDRWDILIMGIRGYDEERPNEEVGAWLTDTIMILSHDRKNKKTSLVSIPRDLYLRIYGEKKAKINEAYEIGVLRKNSLGFSKKLFSRFTGVYIDNAIVIDFSSFKKIVDNLGGIDITLDHPFIEKQQWGYEFSLPAGLNHLDGQSTLYYVRSRYSSSDFDRAQRQQKVIMAIKDKITQLNLLSDPIQSLTILNTIRKNINTDLDIWDTGSLLELSKEFSGAEDKIKRYVLTTENLLYQTYIQTGIGNLYVLLPNGNNLQGIKALFQEILK